MRTPILGIAIAFLSAPCIALAQSPSLNFQKIEHEYKEQKPDGTAARDAQSGLPTGKRMHKPVTIMKEWGAASPNLATQNKPLNPALQGNVLQKGTVGGSTGPTKPTLPVTAGGQRQ